MFLFPPFTAICLNVLALTCGPAPAWPGDPHLQQYISFASLVAVLDLGRLVLVFESKDPEQGHPFVVFCRQYKETHATLLLEISFSCTIVTGFFP